jgi:hypothetical protein
VGKWLTQLDVENRLSASSVGYIFTDQGSNTLNVDALNACIDDAEAEVESWLLGDIDTTSTAFNRADRLIRRCAIDFFCVFAYERRPEYEKTFGEEPRTGGRWKRAQERMERIQASLQKLPDQPSVKPVNSGGIIRDGGPRTCITSADGRQNGDGF